MSSAYRRGGSVNSLTLRLQDARAFDAFKAALQGDPRFKVEVQTTRQYLQSASGTFRPDDPDCRGEFDHGAGRYVRRSQRDLYGHCRPGPGDRDVARHWIRSIPVIVSVLLETMLLAVLGGAIGALVAWAIFDGFTASTAGASGQVVFAFDVSPDLLWNGLKWALAIGVVGGLLPAAHATRMSVTTGLREL